MFKFKKTDSVKILAGKDKNKVGKIEKIISTGAFISGVNLQTKHQKPQGEAKTGGGRIEITHPVPFGKFALICPKCNQPARVKIQIEKTEKYRICNKCKNKI